MRTQGRAEEVVALQCPSMCQHEISTLHAIRDRASRVQHDIIVAQLWMSRFRVGIDADLIHEVEAFAHEVGNTLAVRAEGSGEEGVPS